MKNLLIIIFQFVFLTLNAQTFEASLPSVKNPRKVTYGYADNEKLIVLCDSFLFHLDRGGQIIYESSIPKLSRVAAISDVPLQFRTTFINNC
ncbi:hypothetical protein [Portibacter marinus]|uniref:hypothetical protein n=1 Tax=Portibacter marinus TaxID=2898660 RepID=UPI001F29D000|nr:hypothetical protein [Portibacter marinus]